MYSSFTEGRPSYQGVILASAGQRFKSQWVHLISHSWVEFIKKISLQFLFSTLEKNTLRNFFQNAFMIFVLEKKKQGFFLQKIREIRRGEKIKIGMWHQEKKESRICSKVVYFEFFLFFVLITQNIIEAPHYFFLTEKGVPWFLLQGNCHGPPILMMKWKKNLLLEIWVKLVYCCTR